MANTKRFISWYKDLFESNQQTPPDSVWRKISEQLEVDEVWERLDYQFNYEERIARIEGQSFLPIIALLLLGFLGTLDLLPGTKNNNSSVVSSDPVVVPSSNDPTLNSQDISEPLKLPNSKPKKIVLTVPSSPEPEVAVTLHSTVTGTPLETYNKPDLVYLTVDHKNPVPNFVDLVDAIMVSSFHDQAPAGDCESSNYRFYVGLTASIKNTWVLNNNTFRGLEREELITTIPTFGKDLGLALGYNISSKLTVQTEAMFISEVSQKYNDYVNGKYLSHELKLDYYSFNAQLKFGVPKNLRNQNKASSYLLAGPFLAILKSADLSLAGEPADITQNYSATDFGALLGYEYEIYPLDRFVVSSGIRLKYGFKNIYEGEGLIPASFRRTHTGSVDLNISLRYLVF